VPLTLEDWISFLENDKAVFIFAYFCKEFAELKARNLLLVMMDVLEP
jgi:hypothetical protein